MPKSLAAPRCSATRGGAEMTRPKRASVREQVIAAYQNETTIERIAYYYRQEVSWVEGVIRRWLESMAWPKQGGRSTHGEVSLVCYRCGGQAVDRFKGEFLCRKCLIPRYDSDDKDATVMAHCFRSSNAAMMQEE